MVRRTVERVRSTSLAVLVACATVLQPGAMRAATVDVRHTEGLVHGFLVLRTLGGDTLADGDLIQVARGDQVTSRLVFRFKDGSVHDETAVDRRLQSQGHALCPFCTRWSFRNRELRR